MNYLLNHFYFFIDIQILFFKLLYKLFLVFIDFLIIFLNSLLYYFA